jgi:hypothetical protein
VELVSLGAVTPTACGVFQLAAVKVRVAGERVCEVAEIFEVIFKITFAVGALFKITVKLSPVPFR